MPLLLKHTTNLVAISELPCAATHFDAFIEILQPLRSSCKAVPVLTQLSLLSKLTHSYRETFEGIHLDLSKQPGKCKIAESGLGWKASGGGDPFTLDSSNIVGAQWSRAAKGYELKITSRTEGVVQLDGFDQEVSMLTHIVLPEEQDLTRIGSRSRRESLQALVWCQCGY